MGEGRGGAALVQYQMYVLSWLAIAAKSLTSRTPQRYPQQNDKPCCPNGLLLASILIILWTGPASPAPSYRPSKGPDNPSLKKCL